MVVRAFRRGLADPFEFFLAERLSMTVAELRQRISTAEWVQWCGYYEWKAEEEEREMERRR